MPTSSYSAKSGSEYLSLLHTGFTTCEDSNRTSSTHHNLTTALLGPPDLELHHRLSSSVSSIIITCRRSRLQSSSVWTGGDMFSMTGCRSTLSIWDSNPRFPCTQNCKGFCLGPIHDQVVSNIFIRQGPQYGCSCTNSPLALKA